jgi:lipoprotein-anchoring transpeptidase ErfK/SrfK
MVLQASWLATALAALLAVTTPVAATLTGERVPTPRSTSVLAAPSLRSGTDSDVLGAAHRRPDPAAVVAATGARVEPAAPSGRLRAEPAFEPHLLVRAEAGLVARAHPWSGAAVIAAVPSTSRYYHEPLVLWVEDVRGHGRWGLVDIPYAWPHREGWISLEGLAQVHTSITVKVDLSEHAVRVYRGDELVREVAGATGAASSPTPPGDYVVTDRVPFGAGSALGSFAFGISGIQPRLPAGWTGGDQLAIHGTNAPWSIGRSVSAGCIRVSETALQVFLPLLRQGTPVLIRP